MSLQSPHSSQHNTSGTHGQVQLFSSTSTVSRHFSSGARRGARSGEGVAFDAASTMVKRRPNGERRSKSLLKFQVCLLPPCALDGVAAIFDRGHAVRLRLCSDLHSVFTVARRRSLCVPLARWRSPRRRGASSSFALDHFCAIGRKA